MDDYQPVKLPCWRYGPNGEAQIFETMEDIPEGWTDNPNNFKTSSEAVVGKEPVPADDSAAPATAPVEAKKAKAKKK